MCVKVDSDFEIPEESDEEWSSKGSDESVYLFPLVKCFSGSEVIYCGDDVAYES